MRSIYLGIFGAWSLLLALGAPAHGQYNDVTADEVSLPPDQQRAGASEEQADQRAREGTRLVNERGYFKTTGDCLTFYIAGTQRQYLGLENLALERVGKLLLDRNDQSGDLQWEVTGTLTEYRGTNYLLVTHAVLKSKPARGSALSSAR